jgi:predicted dehydrogenase
MSKKTIMICGLGGHARGSWLKSITTHPDWDLIGVIDTNTELLGNVEKITGGKVKDDQAFMKISEVLRYGDKPDAMVIATPINTHHVLVKEAMEAGINVICEKNLASTIYQGKQMLQLALDHPELCTAVGTQRRYTTPIWTAKKYLNGPDCQIGELNFIQWNDAFNWGNTMYREGWRQYLAELYAEDQMIHWFDLMRWITEMDIVQVYSDCFIPRGIDWQGSSSVLANLALAKPENYQNRHKWVWARFYGDWKRMGPQEPDYTNLREFCGTKGKFKIDPAWGVMSWIYQDETGTKWEEDGYLPQDNIANLGVPYDGQRIILEQMSRGIDSKGKKQPDNNFKDVFKSFAAVMGAIDSTRTGRAIYVPEYWKNML